MNKRIRNLVIGVVGVVTLILVGYIYFQNTKAKNIVIDQISKMTGTQALCGSLSYNPLSRTVDIRKLTIGNPKKFNGFYAVMMPRVLVTFRDHDLETGMFDIESILVENADVNYEADGAYNSNLMEVLQHLKTYNEELPGTIQVGQVDFSDYNISISTIRIKREMGNVIANGFSIKDFNGEDGRQHLERNMDALIMNTVATMANTSGDEIDYQTRRGSRLLLKTLVDQQPGIARSLKL